MVSNFDRYRIILGLVDCRYSKNCCICLNPHFPSYSITHSHLLVVTAARRLDFQGGWELGQHYHKRLGSLGFLSVPLFLPLVSGIPQVYCPMAHIKARNPLHP